MVPGAAGGAGGPASADGEAVLQARSLGKTYGSLRALHDVSFALRRGEVVGFLGPNGAGKSTTMKILTGYVAPSEGGATIAGCDLLAEPLACRRAIGYLPEELPLYLDMRVTAYLDHVARLKGVARAERRREVLDAIEAAHLGEVATRHIRTLSKGNRQRVGLAQALLGRPPILILDEPTSGLDPGQVANFRALVARLAERHAVLLSTHILAEVEACCSRAVVVHRGRTIADEPVSALRARAARGRLRVRVRSGDAGPLAAAMTATGLPCDAAGDAVATEVPDDRRAEVAALAEAHGGLRELLEERLSLEEVFRDLIAAPAGVSVGTAVGTA